MIGHPKALVGMLNLRRIWSWKQACGAQIAGESLPRKSFRQELPVTAIATSKAVFRRVRTVP